MDVYDAAGRRTRITYPIGRAVNDASVTNAAGGHLSGITSAPTASAAIDITASYSYDAYGRLATQAIGSNPVLYTSTYAYDGAGRLTEIRHRDGGPMGTPFQQALYVLDANGNRTRFTDIATQTDDTYDPLDQLLSETRAALTTSYSYDKVGNRLTETTSSGTTSSAYDAANRLTGRGSDSYGYDGSGNQTSTTAGGTSTTWTWDALDRLTSLFGGVTASYTYNGDGLRVRSVVGSTTTPFTWDLGQSVPRLLSDGQDYVYGPVGLLAAVSSGGSCVTYAFTDGLGSV